MPSLIELYTWQRACGFLSDSSSWFIVYTYSIKCLWDSSKPLGFGEVNRAKCEFSSEVNYFIFKVRSALGVNLTRGDSGGYI